MLWDVFCATKELGAGTGVNGSGCYKTSVTAANEVNSLSDSFIFTKLANKTFVDS